VDRLYNALEMTQVDASAEPTPCELALDAARRLLDTGSPAQAESVVRLALSSAPNASCELLARALLAEVTYHAGRPAQAAEEAHEIAAEAASRSDVRPPLARRAELDAR